MMAPSHDSPTPTKSSQNSNCEQIHVALLIHIVLFHQTINSESKFSSNLAD